MTISSSLNAGVSGLSANANRLAAISDNIANASTYGYRRAVTDFNSFVATNDSRTYVAGGVRATNMRLVSERGSLVATGNATDLTVRGRGMMPVANQAQVLSGSDELDMMLTSTGSFRMNENGYLANTSGSLLMGWPANQDGSFPTYARDSMDGLEPIRFTPNVSNDPTTAVDLSLNLPATGTDAGGSGEAETMTIEYFDNLGKSQTITMTFTPTVPATGASNEWTMVMTDSAQDGAVIGEYTLTFDDTVGGGGTISAVTTVTGGAYDDVTGLLSVDVLGGPIEFDIGALGDTTGITQLGDDFAPISIEKDGSTTGNMVSVEVDENGLVRALYDSGDSRVLYKVPLADVRNYNGLIAMDNQTFGVSPESGPFFLWDAGEGPTSGIQSYALEESSVDIAEELTDMIQTQRAYSSNAKVIQTVDEMLQETTNIKR
ncbi:flagellar hook protein FlgE [Salipiger mucosus]|uniref:Flagellar hook protein FlgE n=1 Tax=Salipiger mucosus DSM 16094 TaxID=1123237 RepID=S9QSL1_9RHOB|nr:flagellar hook-basal body complex protein [Salipiger mucosus]EPX82633.1 Flagellar hook protein FlgE [Salipiger mucosus DSM 16094]